MKTKSARWMYLLVVISILAGCSFPGVSTPPDPSTAYTQAAGTIMTTLTLGAFINQASATPLPPVESTATSEPATATPELIIPSVTDAPVATRTPTSSFPVISADTDTNCRSGPGAVYPIITGLYVGQKTEVLGRNNLGTWWYIKNPANSNGACWVWTNTTRVEGDTSSLPTIATPPTPTPEFPTFTISSDASIKNYTGACPVDITLRGTIETDRPTTVKFRWTSDFGYAFDYVTYKFKVAEDESWFQTMTIDDDTTGYIRFRLYEPLELSEDRIKITVDCVP